MPESGPIHFLNLEYFFRLLYEAFFRGGVSDIDPTVAPVIVWLLNLWNSLTVLSFVVSLLALMALVFTTVRIYQIRKAEEHRISTITHEEEDYRTDRSRWEHVAALVESHQESDWRQAIIEADIMLDEILCEQGYQGATVSEKLEKVDPTKFKTLEDAKAAHAVRMAMNDNPEAPLRDEIAYRAVKHYENVFREFKTIDG